MTGVAPIFDDWLLSSTIPGEGNLHFIGAFDRRITFYSQQVRALRLVHALSATGALQSSESVAVVGAGAAGVTAAMAFALLGNDVTLYDPATKILQLQSASPKLLHPHIYEWPQLGSLDDLAGLPFLDWTAGKGGCVCAGLQSDFDAAKTKLPKLLFKFSHSLTSLEKVGSRWRLGLLNDGIAEQRQFDRVILAIGFGDEKSVGSSSPSHYWKENSVGSAAVEPNSPASYLVSGNGDGGLTDLLGLVVQNFDHVGFTQRFLSFFQDDTLRSTADIAFAGANAGDDLEAAFNTHLLPVLTELGVIDRIRPSLRSDRVVTINTFGPLFAFGKAAQLNQIMVFATLHAAAQSAHPIQRSLGEVKDVVSVGTSLNVSVADSSGGLRTESWQHVILRHGPDKAKRYEPARVQFSAYKTHVLELFSKRPELIAPPILDPSTYDFFENLRIEKLEDQASRLASRASSAAVRSTVNIALDSAAHILIERGSQKLIEVAEACERLTSNVILQLDVPVDKIAGARDLVRLSAASGGRILLTASSSVLAGWQGLSKSINQVTGKVPHHPSKPLEASGLGEAVDACLLRLLDQKVRGALSSSTCDTLGPLSASIAAAIGPTWDQWHATLLADKSLLRDFLRWLADVEQDSPAFWDGDHASLALLAAALIMMLATHHGEPVVPALTECGNLVGDKDAVALGSGCHKIGQQPIAIRDQPDQWGVDALILSGSAEVDVLDPPGRVMDGGKPMMGMMSARRVRPVVIQNNKVWRGRLSQDLPAWVQAVKAEFAALRVRQNRELEELENDPRRPQQ